MQANTSRFAANSAAMRKRSMMSKSQLTRISSGNSATLSRSGSIMSRTGSRRGDPFKDSGLGESDAAKSIRIKYL